MALEEENVRVLKQAYARWAEHKGNDFSSWTDIVCDDICLKSPADDVPEISFSLRRDGKDQLVGYLTALTDEWDMVRAEANEFIAQGDRVVVLGRVAWTNKGTGKTADVQKVDVWRFRDGKASEFSEFYDTAGTAAAARP